jgi:hypothetical protein
LDRRRIAALRKLNRFLSSLSSQAKQKLNIERRVLHWQIEDFFEKEKDFIGAKRSRKATEDARSIA